MHHVDRRESMMSIYYIEEHGTIFIRSLYSQRAGGAAAVARVSHSCFMQPRGRCNSLHHQAMGVSRLSVCPPGDRLQWSTVRAGRRLVDTLHSILVVGLYGYSFS